MTGVEHSDWFFGHAHHHPFNTEPSSPELTALAAHTAAAQHGTSVASVLQTLWLNEPPALTVGATALHVDGGGSVALPISVTPSAAHGTTMVTIGGIASYETITDQLDHQVFTASSGSVTLTAAEVNSGLSLASDYTGPGQPVNTLTITASETLGHHTLTSATDTIKVTDPATLTSPPTLTVGATSLTITGGSSVALPITLTPSLSVGGTELVIRGLGPNQSVTDALDHKVFTGNSVSMTAAEADSGLTLSSTYAGTTATSNTLSVAAYETYNSHTLTTATDKLSVITEPAGSGSGSGTTGGNGSTSGSGSTTSGSTGSGSNPLTLQVSGDNYNGDPTIEVFVDGTQVGSSSYTITADHSSGQWQTISINANLNPLVAHQVQVEFTNDNWSGVSWWSTGASPDGNDVNAYVESISLNGFTLEGNQAASNTATNAADVVSDPHTAVMDIDGTLTFNVPADPPATGSGAGSGSGTTSGTGTATVGTGYGAAPSGTGFYVSPTGSDSNPGTLAAPFATLAHAQQAMEGSSIKTTYIEGGTYHLTSTLTLTSADNGESWDYYPANGVDSAILTGGGSLTTMIEVGANNITIDGLTIEDYGQFGIHHDAGANATPITGLTVENCKIGDSTVTGTWQSGAVFIGNVNGITIANNYIFDVQSMGIALYAYNAGNVLDNVSITGNVVIGAVQGMTDGGSIYVSDHGGYHGTNTSITNNYVADYGSASSSRASGIYLDDSASYWTVSGNVIGPPNPASPNSSQSCYAIEVNNGIDNTFTNNVIDLGTTGNVYAMFCYYGDSPATSLTGPSQSGEVFTHNIVMADFSGADSPTEGGAYAFYENSGSASDYTINNNVYYNYGGGQMLTNGPVASDSNPTNANPDVSGWDYLVASSSPAEALGWKTIAGGWGPAGFAIPETGWTPSDV